MTFKQVIDCLEKNPDACFGRAEWEDDIYLAFSAGDLAYFEDGEEQEGTMVFTTNDLFATDWEQR